MKKLTIGKIRGLQQIATREGIFTMCAMDHRGSLQAMIAQGRTQAVDYTTMVQYKMELCQALAPHASAILLDPVYGAAPAIAKGVLSGGTGLLVSLEATGYTGGPEARITRLLEGWSVAKAKRMGASAVKLLLFYRPDLQEVAQQQIETARGLSKACVTEDIPFLVETVAYARGGERLDSPEFASLRPSIVVETARHMAALDIDVFKAEFPADPKYERDEGKLREHCRHLDEASPHPWVLLSGGMDYETFAKQVEIACQAGASGFLAGRAIWQEAMSMGDRERQRFLSTVAADRQKRLSEIAARHAIPWYRKLSIKPDRLAEIKEGWYLSYGSK